MQSFTLTLGLFSHSLQAPQIADVESYDLAEWMDQQADETTLECLEIDGVGFDHVKSLSDLVTLIDWLESQSSIDIDMVADFVSLFAVADLGLYDDMHTGCNDFSEYAQELADDMLSCESGDFAKRYFDYDAFERDLSSDYSVGQYVWRNC